MDKTLTQMNKNGRMRPTKKGLEHWQIVSLGLGVYDALAVCIAYLTALWLRFDCRYTMIPAEYLEAYLQFILVYAAFSIFVFWRMHLYNSIWRFASYSELVRMLIATGITCLFHCVGMTVLIIWMPASYYIFGILIQFFLTLGIRFSYRFVLLERGRRAVNQEEDSSRRVLLIGAGEAGQIILRDIKKAKELSDKVCCIIDDNPNKWGRYIDGIPVEGGRDSILSSVKKHHIDKIFLAIPSATAEEKRDILNICKETGCELKNLPGMYQFMTGEVTVGALKTVVVEDLLGREPIRVNMDEIFEYIQGKTILVTGGGGSIGSELCRQIAGHSPKRLVIFDIYENNAYDIQLELKRKYPDLQLHCIIGSVRDSRKIWKTFEEYRPDIVYHAAAHKHVPLMEDSPCEAIKNNAIGTYKTAYAAMVHGCSRFVLISTDKAVNPTNIMGASKRLCEMIIQAFDYKIKEGKAGEIPQLFTHWMAETVKGGALAEQLKNARTEFVAVRFGNVLGSNGSVIPLFKKQIEAGGPVTVTHPDIIRYFMTIPEAVSLVLQAGTYAKGGEIFVLDMGEPVKIDTLARNLIKLSGYKPDVDIKIEYTGLGGQFFALWVPSQDARQLSILASLTLAGMLFSGVSNCLLNVFTATNKLKLNSIIVIISGLLNVCIVYGLLKTTDLGVYAIAGVSSFVTILRIFLFVAPYVAKCINRNVFTFVLPLLKAGINVMIPILVGLTVRNIPGNGWIIFFLRCVLVGVLTIIIDYFVILNREERNIVMRMIRRKR